MKRLSIFIATMLLGAGLGLAQTGGSTGSAQTDQNTSTSGKKATKGKKAHKGGKKSKKSTSATPAPTPSK